MTPMLVMGRIGKCILLGAAVGLGSDLVFPLRRKAAMLADLMWSAWICWCWVVVCFGVCQGDIRLGYCAAAALGALGWRLTLSRGCRGIFLQIWSGLGWLFALPGKMCEVFLKKIKIFRKKLFPTEEK